MAARRVMRCEARGDAVRVFAPRRLIFGQFGGHITHPSEDELARGGAISITLSIWRWSFRASIAASAYEQKA